MKPNLIPALLGCAVAVSGAASSWIVAWGSRIIYRRAGYGLLGAFTELFVGYVGIWIALLLCVAGAAAVVTLKRPRAVSWIWHLVALMAILINWLVAMAAIAPFATLTAR